MPLDVAFYSDALTSGRYGLGRYAWELFRQLRKRSGDINARPVSAHFALPDDDLAALQAETDLTRLPWSRKLTAGLWSTVGSPLIEGWLPWADVVHCVELDYRVATRRPLVVTVHDLGPLTHPEFFSTSHPWLMRRALQHAVRSAASIICVSAATAEAVEHCAKESLGQRLTIIPEGVGEEFFQPVGEECFAANVELGRLIGSGTPYFLWTGSLNPRKNLPRVIAAFEQVAGEIPHHLVLVGGLGWDSDETLRSARNSPARERIHLPGRVSEAQLRGLYQRASGYVFVSLMEGFGLPILEAMAAGCPVITSEISSMPEVAGNAALLVDPLDTDAIAGAMQRLATDRALAGMLAERGHHRAGLFRWEDCAKSVVEIYQRVGRHAYRPRPASRRSPLERELKPATVAPNPRPAIAR